MTISITLPKRQKTGGGEVAVNARIRKGGHMVVPVMAFEELQEPVPRPKGMRTSHIHELMTMSPRLDSITLEGSAL